MSSFFSNNAVLIAVICALGAVVYGHEQMKAVIDAIHELVRDGGKPEVQHTTAIGK